MNPRIPKLQALLARVMERAAQPRMPIAPAPPAKVQAPVPTVPPTPEARALEAEMRTPPPHAAEPLESRTRVVEEPEAHAVEIDESELTPATSSPPEAVEIVREEEKPPPSSKRPIPMEAIAEAQQDEPAPPPPPESGKLVAAVPAFDDDFTGVREASNMLPPLDANEPPIEVMHVEPPKPEPAHEMEVELSPPPAAEHARRISDVAPAPVETKIEPERTAASLQQAQVVAVKNAIEPFRPKTFGELLDATLDL
jgi:hypothetical protein